MIGIIAIFLLAYWIYRTAQELKLPAFQWVLGAVIVYYLGFAAWMYLVLGPLMGSTFKNHSLFQGLAMDVSAVLVGACLAWLFRSRIMLKQGPAVPQA